MTRRLAAVFAHPDDDTYGVAGTVALHASEGIEVTVVLATRGEAGQIADPSLATRETLGAVREAEDRASWMAVGVETAVDFLGYPDGGVVAVAHEELVAAIEQRLERARPDVVVTFGPDGVTGHGDHVAVGRAATVAFHRLRERRQDRGLRRLLHVGIPRSRFDRWNELLRERGMEPLDPTQPFTPRPVPDDRIAVSVDCRSVFDRKREALAQHRTQAEMHDVPFEAWLEVLGWEDFVQGWPERPLGQAILSDVFEELPGA
ncbi:MAG TPA: PIG-L family deacetylase [Actinomycetota bacterium]